MKIFLVSQRCERFSEEDQNLILLLRWDFPQGSSRSFHHFHSCLTLCPPNFPLYSLAIHPSLLLTFLHGDKLTLCQLSINILNLFEYQSKFQTMQICFSLFSLQLTFEINTVLLSQIWHLFMFLKSIVIFTAQHDPVLILGIRETWTKIRVRLTLPGVYVSNSAGVRSCPPLLFSRGLLSPKHISFKQQKEFPSGPV